MYSMLIVDDDYIAIEGLKDLIDWAALGIQIVGEAEDGAEGLQKARAAGPDIVLTDVVMPGMDGIQLAEALRKEMPSTKILIISGHQDVHYLKSAMKLEAADYILKPFKLEELQESMLKIVGKLEREKLERLLQEEVQHDFTKGIPVMALPEVQQAKEQVLGLIGTGHGDELEKAIRLLFALLRHRHMNSILFLTALCTELMASASRRIAIQTEVNGIEDLMNTVQQFGVHKDTNRLEEFVIRNLLQIETILQDSRTGKALRIVRDTEEIIKQRYAQNITIQKLAEEVFISSSHLQTLFKKETGLTINDYITAFRIEKAKELLKDSAMKVYEVANAVGYQDPNYFTRIFKRLVGSSPVDYR